MESLPQEILVKLTSLLAASAPIPMEDLKSLRSTCKNFKAASSSRIVGRSMNVSPSSIIRFQQRDKYIELLEKCACAGNIDAACILGVDRCFNIRGMLNSGINLLSQAMKEGHLVATYFLGIFLLQGQAEAREQGVQMFELVAGIRQGCQLGGRRRYSSEDGKETLRKLRTEAFNIISELAWWRGIAKLDLENISCGLRCERPERLVDEEENWLYGDERVYLFCSPMCRCLHEYERFRMMLPANSNA